MVTTTSLWLTTSSSFFERKYRQNQLQNRNLLPTRFLIFLGLIIAFAIMLTQRFTSTSRVFKNYAKATGIRSYSSTTVSHNSEEGHFMLILGKPGGGKGTISGKVLKDFPVFRHLSTGDVLRQHVREGTAIGIEAKKHMDEGSLVPDDLMIQLVLEDAKSVVANGRSLLLDGFPRTIDQAIALDKSLDVDLVINLDIPTETIVQRISERYVFTLLVYCLCINIMDKCKTAPFPFRIESIDTQVIFSLCLDVDYCDKLEQQMDSPSIRTCL